MKDRFMTPFQSINPSTERIVSTYPETTREHAFKKIEAAHGPFLTWSRIPFSERAKYLLHAAKILRERKKDLAGLMAFEMGKPLAQGLAEAEKSAWGCEYYAQHAEKFLLDELIASDATKSFVTFEPIGVIFAVMPWNFPLWQIFRFTPSLWMAGNTVILKHAPNVCGRISGGSF